jgi:hypothetical protein
MLSKVKELQHLSLATTYEIDESFDSDKFIKMRLRVCHDGTNPNRSNFKVEDMKNAKDSIKNIPILANVIFDEDGNPQFGGHDMDIEEDKMNEDEYRLIYKETPIGVVPENCNHTIEMFNDKNYVFCDAYIWRGYSNYAENIIERDKDIKLSMEILVDEYSYNAKEKVYNITGYRYQGITFLNKNYGTGMENALATTGTFEENDSKEKFIMMMEELKETLTNYNINNKEEGGSKVDEKIKFLLEQYNVTIEDLSFDIEGMSHEELEEKLKEFTTNKNDNSEEEKEPEKFIKSFELSHSDIRYALYQLLSSVEVEDNEWYFIDQVYDDRFEYVNWEGTKIYRQDYKKDGDNVSFEGDRVELFQERLTKEEKEALDKMRSNYALLETKVNEFEEYKQNYSTPNSEVERLKTFESDTLAEQREEAEESLFSQFDEKLKGLEEYETLKTKASEFTLEELEKECFVVLGKKNANFSTKTSGKKDKVKIEFTKTKTESNDELSEVFDKYLKHE